MDLDLIKKYQKLNHHKILHFPEKFCIMAAMRDLTPPGSTIVEIGCYVGVTSNIFAEGDRKVYCVDLWGYDKDCLTGEPSTDNDGRAAFKIFCENCGDKLFKQIFPIRGFSEEIAMIFPFKVDMVYIDADHTYPAAKNDILLWGDKVKEGGIIAGDDFSLPGVLKSIGETLSQHQQWPGEQWVAKKEHLIRY